MAPPGRERLEVFQRAVAATCRAMAHRPALSVAFRAGDGPRGAGRERPRTSPADRRGARDRRRARSRPSAADAARDLASQDVARRARRGRRRGAPAAPPQRQAAPAAEPERRDRPAPIFEALEQVRVEALGASRMAGVAANLASAHAARGRRQPDRGLGRGRRSPRRSSSTPARACSASSLPRRAARAARRMAQPWLESRTGQDWAGLRRQLGAPGGVRHPRARDAGASGPGRGPRRAARGRGPDRARTGPRSRPRGPTMPPGDGAADDADQAPSDAEGSASAGRARRGRRQRRPPGRDHRPWAPTRTSGIEAPFQTPQYIPPGGEALAYRVFTTQVRRGRRGERAVQPARARPSAQPARPAARPPAGHDRPHRQPPAAPPAGPADPLLGLRPRRGPARYRAPDPGRGQPRARRCRTSSRRTPSSATPWSRC